ncbi:uncharacterized protein F5147DRAFT_707056 [Suillus discolor]|uniref:Uncharacterized protein n=1 Tax=Suillus discolor TaxID=1912936 RepID=A0A9P7F2Z4_9AGAM|nr:uncharacterized protein F5147DRAFT_707056 [Suillus discolor]KAG2102858.1 hypothetical protein F5147DRAFT_707056 [Suillus discolor]
MLCALPLFSFALASVWSLGPLSSLLFVSMGSWVGIRYYLFRDEICDQTNYRLYNVCILCSCLLVCYLALIIIYRYGYCAFIFCQLLYVFVH